MQQKTAFTILLAICVTAVLLIDQAACGNPIERIVPGGDVQPDVTTKPPVITFETQQDAVLNVSEASFPITVKVGSSETAHQKQLFSVSYKCDWQANYSSLYDYISGTMNGSIASYGGEFSAIINLTDIPEGNHNLTVRAQELGVYINNKGQVTYSYEFKINASATLHFAVDSLAPTIELSIENKTYYSADLPLNIITDENLVEISYNIDNQGNISLSGNTTLTGLKLGTHTLTLYASDQMGNSSVKTVSFVIADTFPTALVIVALVAACIVLSLVVIILRNRSKH